MVACVYQEYYTIEDYKKWEGNWELISGYPYAMAPSPMIDHQYSIMKISRILDEELEECEKCIPLVEIDWEINEDTVVRPDVLVICKIEEKIRKTPPIIFEIVSASSSKRDEILKFNMYEKEGVKYYILIYPSRRVAKVYQLINYQYRKMGDFENEKYEFEIKECKIEFDFSKIW